MSLVMKKVAISLLSMYTIVVTLVTLVLLVLPAVVLLVVALTVLLVVVILVGVPSLLINYLYELIKKEKELAQESKPHDTQEVVLCK